MGACGQYYEGDEVHEFGNREEGRAQNFLDETT
jgi:hypothetical protein